MASKNLPTRSERSLSPWSLRDEMMDFFDRFSRELSPFSGLGGLSELPNASYFTPKIEVKDEGKQYLVKAEVPGMSDKDINISLKDNQLILEGEKKQETSGEEKGVYHSEFSYGSFYRSIPLSDDVDTENVNATYKDGILKITVGKKPEAERKSKKIPIKH